jgi:hypothetical protein
MQAQVAQDSKLFITLQKNDSILFEQGFNKCNMAALQKVVHQDLEFVHDRAGIQNREQFFNAVKNNICGPTDNKSSRRIVQGSLKVFPLENNGKLYGAIQTGEHEFYISAANQATKVVSTAKFTHTWLLDNGEWKLYHVLSYDHQ